MSTPELLDIVDLGLTQHFLANDASSAAALLGNAHCLVSLSCDARRWVARVVTRDTSGHLAQQRPCTLASAASQEPGATEFLAAVSAQPTCATQAQHIAFALGERVLIQRQLVPSGSSGKPRLVHLP